MIMNNSAQYKPRYARSKKPASLLQAYKQWIIIGCAAALLIISVIYAISAFNASKNIQATAPAVEATYILSDFEGRLAIYRSGEPVPIEVFDVVVENLPITDQELLSEGLETNSKKQLLLWIEDYAC
ncbi:MAG: hypothetical protein LBS74_08945 [Oscillospiraceae bacterium]|jgi:hypothetical protein|nr:hypothetical protein [Oscillospiraceae bacterium]